MRAVLMMLAAGAALLGFPAAAQLLPGLGLPQVGVPDVPVRETIDTARTSVTRNMERLLRIREGRVEQLLRTHGEAIELDLRGAPARRGELLLIDPDATTLSVAERAGFTVLSQERLTSLDLALVQLGVPPGHSLAEAQALLLRLAPSAEIAPDNLHFQNGGTALPIIAASAAVDGRSTNIPVGIIDGAPGSGQRVSALRGFARGAPLPSDHGSAVVSLATAAGARDVRVADIYGNDPAGGNAQALVRALDWIVGAGAKVVSISLSGPNNAVVGKAIAAAQRKGLVVVAPVGNDGPAAPPAYPASYPGVLAVTAVDGRARLLIEAGRALHLDYAAPGADIAARNRNGKWVRVRGTSYAVPLVAARAAAAAKRGAHWREQLDREAEDLGANGPDAQFGRGLLCRTCAPRPR